MCEKRKLADILKHLLFLAEFLSYKCRCDICSLIYKEDNSELETCPECKIEDRKKGICPRLFKIWQYVKEDKYYD